MFYQFSVSVAEVTTEVIQTTGPSSDSLGVIVGATVGGVMFLVLVIIVAIVVVVCVVRQRRQSYSGAVNHAPPHQQK